MRGTSLRKRILGHLEGTIPVLSETGAGRPQLAEPAPAVVHGGLVGEHGEQHEALAVLEGDGEEAHLHEAASELIAREQRRLRWVRRVAAGAASMACMASMAWAR